MKNKYDILCIGIDQSYKNTGITISGDGKILKIKSVNLEIFKNKSNKRKHLVNYLNNMLEKIKGKSNKIICVIERIRLRSQGFINMDYIQSIGALNGVIIDVMDDYGIPVYSVDTRCWKSQIIGTSKPKNNKLGVPEKKWPTIEWLINKGYEKDILHNLGPCDKVRRKKETFDKDGFRYFYDNDAADSAGISLYWFFGNMDKLKKES